jgi:hypothetical protein
VGYAVNSGNDQTERGFEMNIRHNPNLDIEAVTRLYSEKDGVPVKYVCTSAPNRSAAYAADIFYRETPHPEFGNRYFGLYVNSYGQLMITNADKIEELDFNMVEIDGVQHYSQHRHDFRGVGNGVAIDGGRDYFRVSFADRDSFTRKTLKVKDGEFIEAI